MFGWRSEAILAEVMSQPGHELSFQHAVVATVDGRAQGLCQGSPYGTPSAQSAIQRAAGLRMLRATAVVIIGWPLFAALEKHSPGEWYLNAIAVAPQARGAGLGHRLLDEAFVRAGAAGCDTVALDVDAANVRARALYERLGFRVTSTTRAALLGGVRLHRMSARLPGGGITG
jgi:ribosomal protein S18 acetylase RimI-like enzyme